MQNFEELKRGDKVWRRRKPQNGHKNWNSEIETYKFLQAFVQLIKPRSVLEIGTFEGNSAFFMALGCKWNDLGRVVTIDVEDFGATEMMKEYKMGHLVTAIRNRTDPVIYKNAPYEMAFIDGNHTYTSVKQDLEYVNKLVVDGGYILGHDAYTSGVKQAVEEFCGKNNTKALTLSSHAGIFILQKPIE